MKKIFYFVCIIFISFFSSCKKENVSEEPKDVFYNVSFVDGDIEVSSFSIKENERVNKINDLTKEGYFFLGWKLNDTLYDFDLPVTKDIKLQASWEKMFLVTFHYEDELCHEDKVWVRPNEKVEEPTLNLPDGYILDDWYFDTSYTSIYNFRLNVTDNLTLYAHIEQKPVHNIIYNLDDGVLPTDAKTTFTESVSYTLPIPTKENYIFIGWYMYSVESGVKIEYIPSAAKHDYEVYALFGTDKTYSITYELNGGIFDSNVDTTYSGLNESKIYLPNAYKEGYFFRGFYETVDFTDKQVVSINPGSVGNKTYYAKYVKASLENAKISIFGDSISTFYKEGSAYNSYYTGDRQYYYPIYSATVKEATDTWWMKTILGLNASLCVNCSYSGSTASGNFPAGENEKRIVHLYEQVYGNYPDIVIIYFGTNDNTCGYSVERFIKSYKNMLDQIYKKMPHVDIYVMNLGYTSFKGGVYTEERRIEYNNALSNLTKTYPLNIINVSNVITQDNSYRYLGDNLHYNIDGMTVISEEAIATIQKNYSKKATMSSVKKIFMYKETYDFYELKNKEIFR